MFNPLSKALGICSIVLLLACGVLYVRCGQLTNKNDALHLELSKVQDANLVSQQTITSLVIERNNVSRMCEARLAEKERRLNMIQSIDKIKGGNDEKNPTVNNNGGDALLSALNSMYPASTDNKNGVCKTEYPANSGRASMVSGTIRYCFCSDEDVRNLLKNFELDKSDRKDRILIQDGLR